MNWKTFTYLTTITLLALSLSRCGKEDGNGSARTGTEISSGGDSYAQEFTSVGYQIVNDLREHPVPPIDEAKLNEAIRATKVESKPELTLEGREVGAINHPDSKRIEVSRKHWDTIAKEPPKKELLVLHEFLGIMGVDDSSYQVSSLMDRGKVCNRNPSIVAAIEYSLKRQCNRITKYDLQFVESLSVSNGNIKALQRKDLWGLTKLATLRLENSGLEEIEIDAFVEVPVLSNFEVLQKQSIESKTGMFRALGKYSSYVGITGPFKNVTSRILEGIGGTSTKGVGLSFGMGGLIGADVFSSLSNVEEASFFERGGLDLDSEIPKNSLRNASFKTVYLAIDKKDLKIDSIASELIGNPVVKTVIGVGFSGPKIVREKFDGVSGFKCGSMGGIMNYFGCTRP